MESIKTDEINEASKNITESGNRLYSYVEEGDFRVPFYVRDAVDVLHSQVSSILSESIIT